MILSNDSVSVVFGYLGTVLSLVAYFPYLCATLRHQIQPDRASWLIWAVLSSVSFFSQLHEGANASLGFVAGQMVASTVICVLALRRGQGVFLRTGTLRLLGLCAAGVLVSCLTSDAVFALGVSIAISLVGGSITLLKAIDRPDSENLASWALSCLAAILALVAVGPFDWVLMAYPFYIALLSGSIVLAIMVGREQNRRGAGISPAVLPSAFAALRARFSYAP